MALFLVVSPDSGVPSPYEEAIAREFADNFLTFGPQMWAISSPGIAKDVSVKIHGETVKNPTPTLIVVAVSGYWGVAPNNVWEWFASKLNATHVSK